MLAAAFTGVMVSFAPIVPYTFSLFLDPLHAAFGWKREAMGGAFALAAITVALVSPLIGLLLDRFPPRRIILPGILVFAAGLATLSRLTPHILQFYATFFIIGRVANATAQFAYTRTILTWFTSHRGFALALLLTGSGVGSILIPPVTEWMIQHHGWRSAFLLLGGIAILGFPLTALLVRNRPEAAIVRTAHRADTGVTVTTALRTAAFWILAFITILSAFSENGLVTNLASILTQHGVLAASAALALSVRGGASIIGRLGVGFAIDRVSPECIQSLVLALAAAEHSSLLLPAAQGQLCRERPCLAWGWAAKRTSPLTCSRVISDAGISQRYMVLAGQPMPLVALLGRCGLGTCMIAPVLICRDSSFILRQWHW